MKPVVTAVLLVVLCCTARVRGSQATDEARIRQLVADQESAWNRGNARDYCVRFQTEGAYTVLTGTTVTSRGAFEERVGQSLAGVFSGSVISYTVKHIRFVAPGVALVHVDTEASAFKSLPAGVKASGDGRFRTNTLLVLIKEDGEWWVTAYHNVDVKVP